MKSDISQENSVFVKLHLIIATLALTACSVTQAQSDKARLTPPSPWEKVDLVCTAEGGREGVHVDMYRHPAPGEHYWEGVSDDGYVSQYWSDDDALSHHYSTGKPSWSTIVYEKVDRMTGRGNLDLWSNSTPVQCKPRPVNKF